MTGCTYGPYATTGVPCGAPAVVTFAGTGGETLAECAGHVTTVTVHTPTTTKPVTYCKKAACIEMAMGPGRVTHLAGTCGKGI